MLIGVGVSCRISHSIVSCLYVSFSDMITSVGEECYSLFELCDFHSQGFPLPLGTWDMRGYYLTSAEDSQCELIG